jgi:CubicO group peptidase (beta-lactamase class C family)
MRTQLITSFAVLAACATTMPAPAPAPSSPLHAAAPAPALQVARLPERLAVDTPRTTTGGATFIAPAGWSIEVRGSATVLEAPEGDSRLALVDVRAADADAAVAAAWAAYQPETVWPLKVTTTAPDKDGWSDIRNYGYQVSPNEKRDVEASARRAGEVWTVAIYDMAQAVGEKRLSAVSLVYGRLLPKGYVRESFAGRKALPLDADRLARLRVWVETAMKELKVPGVSYGIVQDGKVVFQGGLGAKELGQEGAPDADTLFMIASNTKALTTLMLARLVDQKRIAWDTPVTSLLPTFKLGDAETTRQVLVKHLICACTGLPRQDYEWLLEFQGLTCEGAMATLATMQPTSKFGEMFQYSNPMAAAAGFVGGHLLYPELELGQAYDEAMRTQVFGPLGMKDTTFDFAKALRGNHAGAHAPDVDGHPARAAMEINYSMIPVRPAGAAWSSVRDMLRYVSMELAEGKLPAGERYIDRAPLLERRVPQVPIGKDDTYGMGLGVNRKYGIPVVHHGGDMIGFHSDMLWLPEHGVGAVVLTNADPGWILRTLFRRKLLEVLFDGRPEADADVASQARTYFAELAAERKLLTVPADPAEASTLAARYANPALGEIAVARKDGAVTFDFGEWTTEVASRRNPDGTTSFVTIVPGGMGFEFVVGGGPKRTLIVRDAQHEYLFTER